MSQLDDIKYKDWDSNKRIELTLFLKDYREKFISHMKSKDIPKSDEEIEQYNNEKREFWNGLRLIAGIWIVDIRDSIFSNILFPWKDTYFQIQNAKKDAFQRFSESPKDINIKKEFDKIDEKFGDEFNDKGLLIFLITNGYIDETYSYYISHFYEESITKDDRDFILSIRERRAKDYSYKLERIDEILMQIHDYEYGRKEILNYNRDCKLNCVNHL